MANAFYPKYKGRIAAPASLGGVDFLADNIKAVLVSSDYSYDAADEFHSDLTGILATSANLTGKTVSADGIYDADSVIFAAVTGTVAAVVLYKDTGISATSPLILYIDDIDGLPGALTDTDVNLSWNTGTNKIAKL